VHETAKDWVSRLTSLAECWNTMEQNVEKLNSLMEPADSTDGENDSSAPAEDLEDQLSELKEIFATKERLLAELEERYGSMTRTLA
jgi:uncharacterized protein (DUF342 family)